MPDNFHICHFQKSFSPHEWLLLEVTCSLNLLDISPSEVGGGMVMKSVISVICLGRMRWKSHLSSSLPKVSWGSCKIESSWNSSSISWRTKQSSYTEHNEMELGDGGRYCVLPNFSRVSTWILTKPVLEANHPFSKLHSGQRFMVRLLLMWILEELSPTIVCIILTLLGSPFPRLKWTCFISFSKNNSYPQAEALRL